jgi:hypothetical protein
VKILPRAASPMECFQLPYPKLFLDTEPSQTPNSHSRLATNFNNKVISKPTVTRPLSVGVKPILEPKTLILLLSEICGFVRVGCPFFTVIFRQTFHRQSVRPGAKPTWGSTPEMGLAFSLVL